MAKSKPKGGDPISPWQNRIVGYETIPAGQLTANPLNWRIHPGGQQQALEGVIDSVGWVQNVIVNKRTGNMIDGHLRATLALRRGEETPVPVTIVDLSEEEEAVILASLDPLAAMAGTDKAKLDELLHAAQSDNEQVQGLLAAIAEQSGLQYGAPPPDDPGAQIDRADELRVKWGVELGQLWRIPSLATPGAEHRIICGDCTDAAAVARVMGGEKADACISDPPYGIDFDTDYTRFTAPASTQFVGVNKNHAPIYGDKKPFDPTPLLDFDAVILFGANFYADKLPVGTWLVWDKRFENGKAWLSDAELAWMKSGQGVYIFSLTSQGMIRPEKVQHPTQKPVALMEWCIEKSKAGKTIYDPYFGSGTTLIACERLARLGRGVEISPAYVAVALERLAGLGLKPELAGDHD